MQQEARNTEGRNIWFPASELRHKAVHFVRGGSLEPEEKRDRTASTSEKEPCTSMPETESGETELDTEKDDIPHGDENTPYEPTFFIDRSSQSIAPTGLPDPVSRLRSSSPDDSSGDEIVFHGRNRFVDRKTNSQHPTTIDDDFDPQSETVVTDQSQNPESSFKEEYRAACTPRKDNKAISKEENSEQDDENDILADYIANIDVEYEETDTSSSARGKLEDKVDFNKLGLCPLSPRLTGNPRSVSLSSSDDLKELNESEASGSEIQFDEDLFNEEIDLENIESLHRIASRWNTNVKSDKTRFASASAFADALEADPYYGFDIMDFNRPSLRKKAKGRKGPPDLMLSDSELEMELERAWSNDREKKKSKKQKREQLRSQGLLGRSIEKPDLKSKYAHGMGVGDLKSEIRAFLLSSKDRYDSLRYLKEIQELSDNLSVCLYRPAVNN